MAVTTNINVIKELSPLFLLYLPSVYKPKPVVVIIAARNVGKLITPFKNATAMKIDVKLQCQIIPKYLIKKKT